MKKIVLVAVTMMVMAITVIQAQAARIWCEGIPNVSMNITWGILYIDVGYGSWDICSIQSDRNGIKKEVCSTILKAVLLAESEGKKVQFTFDADNGESCDMLGDWAIPSPFPYHMNFSK